ncbi:hypothetical protein PXD56_09945 [Maribacter sp. SA7]|uniref:hypothetical protein n=1 Tax=Maribacter zhoushanensis TaxID=3030012 RepID=UPI0023EC5ADF|nr:hypothetical protein [Maribacter zhoushanensis]MDF4203277.1 hypothetical protein [Maribacter zhoushanensis]
MTFYERYMDGETTSVYNEIEKLDFDTLSVDDKIDIDKVLTETFERVHFNSQIIYNQLIEIGYLFKTEFEFNFERPLHKPLVNTESLIKELDSAVSPFGYVPLSLKYFYRIVGGVNFVWDYETNSKFMWNMADPIQVASIDSIVEEVINEDWIENIQPYVDDEEFGCAFLDLSADDLHKDNASGGQPYSLEITKKQTIDGRFLNEVNETSFINYLRICFDYCGFPGITYDENNDYQSFFDKVKPLMKKI